MVRLTLIARVRDGLPLAEGLDSDKEHNLDVYKQQAKVQQLCAFCAAREGSCSGAAPEARRCGRRCSSGWHR